MNMDSLSKLSMDGKIAVVTGSTQGLGEAIAHLFADRGCKGIVITGRNEKNGTRVKADLEKKGVKPVLLDAASQRAGGGVDEGLQQRLDALARGVHLEADGQTPHVHLAGHVDLGHQAGTL